MHESLLPTKLPTPARGLVWNPYFQILLTVVLTAAAQILLKVGADASANDHSWLARLGVARAGQWLDVAGYPGLRVQLRQLALRAALSAAGTGLHADEWRPYSRAAGGLAFPARALDPRRIAGIAVIIVGILFLAQSVARAEEKA